MGTQAHSSSFIHNWAATNCRQAPTAKFVSIWTTIRLVANNQAGSISGSVSGYDTDATTKVYAYQAGTFTEEEAADPAEEQARFPNAISSDVVDNEGYYHLAYLAPGSYDLVVVSANENGVSVLSIEEQLGVESRQNTNYDIVLGVEVEVEIEAGTATEE